MMTILQIAGTLAAGAVALCAVAWMHECFENCRERERIAMRAAAIAARVRRHAV